MLSVDAGVWVGERAEDVGRRVGSYSLARGIQKLMSYVLL